MTVHDYAYTDPLGGHWRRLVDVGDPDLEVRLEFVGVDAVAMRLQMGQEAVVLNPDEWQALREIGDAWLASRTEVDA